jgi:hypothetical protein
MTRKYAPYQPRKTNLANPFMRGNEFLHKLRTLQTLDDKRCHIVEHNPLLLIFGENLNPRNPYEGEQHGQD